MSESIKVAFIKVNQLAGKDFYHGTLVYTNNQGQRYFMGGDVGNSALTSEERAKPLNVIKGELALLGVGSSPYGNLVTVQGSTNDSSLAAYKEKWLDSAVGEITLASAVDLKSQWTKASVAMVDIQNTHMPYAPTDMNSNSAWCTAARAADILPSWYLPSNLDFSGSYWTPGCETTIKTTYTSWNLMLLTVGSDEKGNQTVTSTSKNADNSTAHSTTISSSYEELSYKNSNGRDIYLTSGSGNEIHDDNATILATKDSQVSIFGEYNIITANYGANTSIYGTSNDIYATFNNDINFQGNHNFVDAAQYTDIVGNGSNNIISTLEGSDTLRLNEQVHWDPPANGRLFDIHSNSVSGASYALDSPNMPKGYDSPSEPQPWLVANPSDELKLNSLVKIIGSSEEHLTYSDIYLR
ncbi:hypothetical protein [Massilia sp. YIM B04103]|uniref:hypothetical protein n=1 Tax=Massilia sp. YIM B04103 TaxID=2963106 RepID=UPI00210CD924|nr:hypothetical protein [Massilia sp. YIM B04103]